MLLAMGLVKEDQKGETDCQSLALWGNATAPPTHDDLQASIPYLGVLAQHLASSAKVDEMRVLPEEIDGTNPVIVPT